MFQVPFQPKAKPSEVTGVPPFLLSSTLTRLPNLSLCTKPPPPIINKRAKRYPQENHSQSNHHTINHAYQNTPEPPLPPPSPASPPSNTHTPPVPKSLSFVRKTWTFIYHVGCGNAVYMFFSSFLGGRVLVIVGGVTMAREIRVAVMGSVTRVV